MLSSETKENNLTRAGIKSSDKFLYFAFIRQYNTANDTKNNNVLPKDRVVILCLSFRSIQPQQPLWQLLHTLLLIPQACTVHPFLPANYTSLPDTGNLREMLKWQLCCLHRSVLRSPYAAMQFLDKLRNACITRAQRAVCLSRSQRSEVLQRA